MYTVEPTYMAPAYMAPTAYIAGDPEDGIRPFLYIYISYMA